MRASSEDICALELLHVELQLVAAYSVSESAGGQTLGDHITHPFERADLAVDPIGHVEDVQKQDVTIPIQVVGMALDVTREPLAR